MARLLRRLGYLLRQRRREGELAEEIELHREMKRQELEAQGFGSSGTVQRELGNLTLAREESRAVWIPTWFEQLRQDLRYALRLVRRNPGFSAVVIVTLAFGIGMNAAVFSVFNAVLLRPLSFQNPDRLVWIGLQSEIPSGAIPVTEFVAWREQATSFERMVAYENTQDHTIQTADAGTQARNAWVSEDFWPLSGVRPALGRLPHPGEPAVVLSHGFFERWFQSDPDVVGRLVTINGREILVTGVLPREFRFHLPQEALGPALDRRDIDIYRHYGAFPSQERGRGLLVRVVAELKPDVNLETARAELEAIRGRLAQVSPQPFLDRATLTIVPLRDRLVGGNRGALWVLLGAVSFVLLIACANIASLMLARAATRQKEIAIRISVGAGRARVLRQFLAESLVLALLGGTAGLLVAHWALSIIVGLIPQAVPRLTESTLDARVFVFAFGASLVTALLVGLGPVIFLGAMNTQDVLKDAGSTLSASSKSLRLRRLLVTTELALAVVLLTGAGLMVKSFWLMNVHPPGFHPERILTTKVMFTAPNYIDGSRRRAFVDELLGRLHSVPGVEAAGITTGGASPLMPIIVEDAPALPNDPDRRPTTLLHAVSAGYLRAMGVRLVGGRWVSDVEPEPVVVITESVARREFRSEDPIGKRIRVSGPPGQAPMWASIVGIVGDLKYSKLDADPSPDIYIPYRHHPTLLRFTAIVRTPSDPLALAPAIRGVVSSIDKTLPIFDAMTLEQALVDSVAPRRFNLFLLTAFAVTAVLVALVGIYGVVAYSVAQRTHEIGIRMALGARPVDVVRLVAQQGLWIIVAGIGVGVLSAVLLTRLMSSLLYQVDPADPQAFAVVTAMMVATAVAACLGPTLKACLVDPVVTLRYE